MSQQMMTTEVAPNYKLEIPAHLQHLLFAGLVIGGIGVALLVGSELMRVLGITLLVIGVIAIAIEGLLLLVINNKARLNARRQMMEAVSWRGDEMVLDVGCGNGFLMLEAAKHLTTGKAIGIDVWVENSGGQSGREVQRNAQLEGVADKIDVQNVDARSMSFEAGTFDVIMSSLALHHMGSNDDRERAFREITRVLKPGGTILLYDMFPMINQAERVLSRNEAMKIRRLDGLVMRVIAAKR
ncbi:MAG: methyltransferase domain-containing protein [Anaerolineaceae bacterium]|nr:methyltransferase domain-containing protein [Anaerolineaceae bacterium]